MHRYEIIIIIKSSRSGSAMKTGLKSRSCFSVLIEHDLRVNALSVCCEVKPLHTGRVVARGLASPDHALEARQTPTDDHRLKRAARFVVAPLAVGVMARERQLISAALILTQHLDRQARRRHSGAIEFSQSSFARSHFNVPRL